MIRIFCDICSKELTANNRAKGGKGVDSRLGVEIGGANKKFSFEVTVFEDSVANKGDVCKYCIIDALCRLDDRPQVANQ